MVLWGPLGRSEGIEAVERTDVVHLRRSLIDQVIVFAGEIKPSGP